MTTSREANRISAPPTVAELVELLQRSGGAISVADPAESERRQWRQLLYVVSVDGGTPDGFRLRYTGRDRGDLVIRMVLDTPENRPRLAGPELAPVPVPPTLRRLHPLLLATQAAAQKGHGGWINTFRTEGVLHVRVTPAAFARTLRLAQALITEAERRGGSARRGRCGIGVAVRGHLVELVFTEENNRKPHVLTPAELKSQEAAARPSPSGYPRDIPPIPKYDHCPSGRLVLRSGHDSYGSTMLANDRTRWTMEDRLPLAMAKIEELTVAEEERQLAREQAAAERRIAWEAAVADARVQWVESQLLAELTKQLDRRRLRREIEDLVAELQQAHMPLPGSPGASWLAWATSHAQTLDDRIRPLDMPRPTEPSMGDLDKLLRGWSAYGP